jgi:hypothetical protein
LDALRNYLVYLHAPAAAPPRRPASDTYALYYCVIEFRFVNIYSTSI